MKRRKKKDLYIKTPSSCAAMALKQLSLDDLLIKTKHPSFFATQQATSISHAGFYYKPYSLLSQKNLHDAFNNNHVQLLHDMNISHL